LICAPGSTSLADNVQQIIGADPFSFFVSSELMPWKYQSPIGEAAGWSQPKFDGYVTPEGDD
jgi:hypothetical protein